MPNGSVKKFVVQCVRGNPAYGKNDFADNGDGTITDKATGLMWAQADSGKGLDWKQALAWAQEMNAQNYLGHDDWRVPGVKELQSIIDYTRSPDTTQSAAIDPLFTCTQITNENGQPDYPCYWTSTTHIGSGGGGETADYLAFGRAMGYMAPGMMPAGPGADGPGGPAARAACRDQGRGRQVDGCARRRGAALRPQGGRPLPVPVWARPSGRRHPHLQLRAVGARRGLGVASGGSPAVGPSPSPS